VIIDFPPAIEKTVAPTEVEPTFKRRVSPSLISVTDSGFLLPSFCFTPNSLVSRCTLTSILMNMSGSFPGIPRI